MLLICSPILCQFSLGPCHFPTRQDDTTLLLNIRFNDRSESRLALSVDEPVNEVSGHFGGAPVNSEEANVVLEGPGISEADGKLHTVVGLLFFAEFCQG